MTVRIATLQDADLVAAGVKASGNNWSIALVKERLTDPWITAISVNANGVCDGVLFANYSSQNSCDVAMIYGPVGPNVLTWLRMHNVLAQAVSAEIAARHPAWVFTSCVAHWQIGLNDCQVSPYRTAVDTAMGWKVAPNAISDGYDALADGSHKYHINRNAVLAKLATI